MKNHSVLFTLVLALTFACNTPSEEENTKVKSPDELISELEPQLINDSTFTINYEVAKELLPAYLKFSETHPDDPKSADYLYKTAEISQGLGQGNMAIKYYEKFFRMYPEHNRAPISLFQQGFIYETLLDNKEMAVKQYQKFLAKFPEHELASSAEASIQNIDKTPEELIEEFKKRREAMDTVPNS